MSTQSGCRSVARDRVVFWSCRPHSPSAVTVQRFRQAIESRNDCTVTPKVSPRYPRRASSAGHPGSRYSAVTCRQDCGLPRAVGAEKSPDRRGTVTYAFKGQRGSYFWIGGSTLPTEFDEPSALDMYVHCSRCFQPLSPLKVRCGRCGTIDRRRVVKAAADLVLGTTALIGAIGIVGLAFLSQGF